MVLDTLAPAERLAFVLHDMFAVPFEEIAPVVGRYAGRGPPARQPRPPPGAGSGAAVDADRARQREVVDAFLAASRGGDFDALLAVLDPEVVFRADGGAVPPGASREARGARVVAEQALTFSRLALAVQPVLVNGAQESSSPHGASHSP